METNNPGKRRLKQQDLVSSIFRLFADEYENSDAESIWDINLPIERIKEYLKEKHDTSYRSNLWIYTQLKRYEEEAGIRLFTREQSGQNNQMFNLRIYDRMLSFAQKQHLYVTRKIKVANGVFDKIINRLNEQPDSRPVTLMLGAGSTIFHLAEIIAEYSQESRHEWHIYTHNIGVIHRLLASDVNSSRVKLSIPGGNIDPATYCIVSGDVSFYQDVPFDFIVQGTSSVVEGELFIESVEESAMKEAILHNCSGEKILVLTKHEFSNPLAGRKSYGKISDYDFLVIPRIQKDSAHKKDYEKEFDRYRDFFQAYIVNWNYEILSS